MKKLITTLTLLLSIGASAQAQFANWGVRLGSGVSYLADELLTSKPIVAYNIGAYTNLSIGNNSGLYLQGAFNVSRRGSYFELELDRMNSFREGKFDLWYAQIPITLCYEFELPIQSARHMINVSIGPIANIGLIGTYKNRQVTLGYSSSDVNHDSEFTDTKNYRAFRSGNARMFDIGAQVGIGYRHGNFTLDLIIDHGFVPIRYEEDLFRLNTSGRKRNAFGGTNQAFVLAVGYQLPIAN